MRALPPGAVVLSGLFFGCFLVACPKTESAGPGPTEAGASDPAASAAAAPSAASAASAVPSAVQAVATATPSAVTTAAASAATTATAASAATGAKTAPAASASAASAVAAVDAGPTCGTKPLPDCPLQAWMKVHTAQASASGDLPALATALDKIAKMSPPGYANWASISKDGATAARGGSLEGARASCTGCHNQYRKKYRDEARTRPVP